MFRTQMIKYTENEEKINAKDWIEIGDLFCSTRHRHIHGKQEQ